MQDLWRCPRASVLRVHFLGFSKGWSPHALRGVLEEAATCYPRMHGRKQKQRGGCRDIGCWLCTVAPDCPGIDKLNLSLLIDPAHSFVLCCQSLTFLHYLEFNCCGWAHPQTRMRVTPWHWWQTAQIAEQFLHFLIVIYIIPCTCIHITGYCRFVGTALGTAAHE